VSSQLSRWYPKLRRGVGDLGREGEDRWGRVDAAEDGGEVFDEGLEASDDVVGDHIGEKDLGLQVPVPVVDDAWFL
jgi:hypothetical protein